MEQHEIAKKLREHCSFIECLADGVEKMPAEAFKAIEESANALVNDAEEDVL